MALKTPWMLSSTGRRVAKAVAAAGVAGGFLIHYLPNTLFIDQYKIVTQLYKNGIPVKLGENITPLVETVMNDLEWTKDKQSLISVYTGFGFDIFRAGSVSIFSRGVLGVPNSFRYANIEEFDRTGILVNNEAVPWSTPAGISLKESLVLSENAKKFAIARELSHLNTAEPLLHGLFNSSVLLMCYTISSNVNVRLNLYARQRGLRVVFYGLVSAFAYATWILCKDVSVVSNESSADEQAASINVQYAQGGLEYYEKILQRNIALRSLMGETGEGLYTAFGNDQVVLRTKHTPFTTRRDNLKDRVQEFIKLHEGKQTVDSQKPDSSIDVTAKASSLETKTNPASESKIILTQLTEEKPVKVM